MRRLVRWGLRHGVPRAVMARRARAGDLGARIMFDTAVRAEPFAYYEQLRARGRLMDAGVARCTVDHDLCSAVLRSPDFGSPSRHRVAAAAGPVGAPGGRPATLSAAEPPSMLVAEPPSTPATAGSSRAPSRPGRRRAALPHRGDRRGASRRDGRARARRVDLVRDYAPCCRSPSSPRCWGRRGPCASSSCGGAPTHPVDRLRDTGTATSAAASAPSTRCTRGCSSTSRSAPRPRRQHPVRARGRP